MKASIATKQGHKLVKAYRLNIPGLVITEHGFRSITHAHSGRRICGGFAKWRVSDLRRWASEATRQVPGVDWTKSAEDLNHNLAGSWVKAFAKAKVNDAMGRGTK